MYYKDILARQEQVNEQIQKLEKEIAKYPKNELICVQNGKYTKWFQTDGHNPIYIPKRDKELAEALAQPTSIGIKVRSKSEVLIVTALHAHRIPFHYEEALVLGRKTIFPDFTIRHPRTGKTYYWEHLGMLDREDYRKKNLHKLNDYIANGIIPSENLIHTYETDEIPLDMELVENYINYYFGVSID